MTVFLNRGGLYVDSSKVIAGGTTYPLGHISAYKARWYQKKEFNWKKALIYAVGAGFLSIVIVEGVFEAIPPLSLGGMAFVGAAGFLLSLWAMHSQKEPHDMVFWYAVLELTSAGTTSHALVVKNEDDKQLCYDGVEALDKAIAAYGRR